MRRLALCALLCGAAGAVHAQVHSALVVGTVVDRTTGLPLSGVAVSATGATGGAASDDEGFFSLQVPGGRIALGLSRAGYVAGGVDTTAADGDTLRIRFTMISSAAKGAQPLATVAVTEKGGGLPTPFLRRKDMKGGGRFFVAEDIKKLNPPHTPGLLQRITGGMIMYTNGSAVLVTTRSQAMMGPSTSCPYSIIINDLTMPTDFDLRGIKTEDLLGVEVYNGPSSIPLELGGTSGSDLTCGLVVIWTKGNR